MAVRRSKALENVDKLTWDWMTKTMHELDAIAEVAYKEAKSEMNFNNLDSKIELQRIAKRAIAGRAAVAKIFGETS